MEALRLYKKAWAQVAAIPCVMMISFELFCFAVGQAVWVLLLVGLLLELAQHFLVFLPIFAWLGGCDELHRAKQPPAPDLPRAVERAQPIYRGAPSPEDQPAPDAPEKWFVSGRCPWWAVGMFFLLLLIDYFLFMNTGQGSEAFVLWLMVRFFFCCFWLALCARDAARAGILERAEAEDAPRGFVLRQLDRTRPVSVVRFDAGALRLRLADEEESVEVWKLVGPIDVARFQRELEAARKAEGDERAEEENAEDM